MVVPAEYNILAKQMEKINSNSDMKIGSFQ